MMKYANICLLKLTFGSNHLLLSFFISCHEVHFSASYLVVDLKKIFIGEIFRKKQKYHKKEKSHIFGVSHKP